MFIAITLFYTAMLLTAVYLWSMSGPPEEKSWQYLLLLIFARPTYRVREDQLKDALTHLWFEIRWYGWWRWFPPTPHDHAYDCYPDVINRLPTYKD